MARIPPSFPATLAVRRRLLAVVLASCFVEAVHAMPVDPRLVSGAATFNQSGNVLTINNSHNAILDWRSFNIAAGEAVRFNQPSASSSVLNRVLGNDPSQLLGQLGSNGRVWLVNPAGILVGPGARIDTAGFVASTLNIRNEDFLAGRLNFQNTPGAGSVVNQGAISTPDGGSVYLVASDVSNEGIITTPQGETILAAGQTVELIDTATPGVKVEITGAAGNATNLGTIVAEAGRVGVVGVLVRNSGNLNASSVVNEGGRIFLRARQETRIDKEAVLTATGSKGGRIEVLGDRVAVTDESRLDASGKNGGGSVLVGGDNQGGNPDIQNAAGTYFGLNASIAADAQQTGEGGKVIIWANDNTRAHGSISAHGGTDGGKGGFVETSAGHLDTSGIRLNIGQGGTWLLDPYDITIGAADVTSSGTGGNPDTYTGSASASAVAATTIMTQLNAGTSVIVDTTGAGGDVGDITVSTAITKSAGGAATLTLKAHDDIFVNVPISSTVGKLNVVLTANQMGGAPNGQVNVSAAGSITTNHGDFTATGKSISLNATVDAGSGAAKLVATSADISNGAGTGLITANTLEVNAQTNIALTGNNQFDIVAATANGAATIENAKSSGLTVGTVGGTTGVTAGGNVMVKQYSSGDILVNQSVSTSGGDVTVGVASGGGALAVAASKVVSGSNVQVYTSGGAITLNGTVTGTTNASVNGGAGNIVASATGAVIAPSISLQSSAIPGGSIGSAGTPFRTSSPGGTGNANVTIGIASYGPGAVYLAHTGDLTLQSVYAQNAAPIEIGTQQNLTTNGSISTTSSLSLLAGNLLTVPNGFTLAGANITLTANRMALQGAASSINSGAGLLWLKPATVGGTWNIDLGSAIDSTANTLELSAAELNSLAGSTAGTLRIGAMTAGNLHLSGPVAPTGFSTGALSFESGGTVDQATSADIITANKLAVKALGNVNLNVAPNLVTNLAAQLGDGTHQNRSFLFKNGPSLNVGSAIDGVNGISINLDAAGFNSGSPNGVIALVSSNALTQSGGALLAGKAVYADGARVVLNEANPTGVISGKTTGSSAGDIFSYTSSNGINVTTVNGFSGIQSGVPADAASVWLSAGSAGISQDAGAPINAGAGTKGLMLSTTGAVNLVSNANSVGSLGTGGSTPSSLNFVNAGAMTIGVSGNGISANNGAVNVTAGGLLTVQNGVAAGSGSVGLEAPNLQLGVPGTTGAAISGGLVKLRASQTSTGAISMGASTTATTVNGSDIELEADNYTFNLTPAPVFTASNTVALATVTDNRTMSVSNTLGQATINAPWLIFGVETAADSNTTGDINLDVAINRPGQGVLFFTGGGITQSTPITAQQLVFKAGSVTGASAVNLGVGNQVATLAGTTSGGAISFKNSVALTVGTVSGGGSAISGLASGGGAVSVATSTGGITLTSPINAGSGVVSVDAGGGTFVNNVGAGAMVTTSRWLVYAVSPANVTKNGLVSAFRHYNATYASYPTPGEAGNGFIYASTPGSLTVDTSLASGATSHVFGQTPTAVFDYSLVGTYDAEDIIGTATFSPALSSSTSAGAYTVGYDGGLTNPVAYSGSTMANPVSYIFVSGAGVPYTVDPAELTIVATLGGSTEKVYDGTTHADLTSDNFLLSGFVGTDDALVTKTSGVYASKNVGTGLLVTATLDAADFSPVGTTDLSNYTLPASASGHIGTITPATLSVSGYTAFSKVYDGTTDAKLDMSKMLLTGLISGDDVSATGMGSFDDKNVGVAKPVTLSSLSLNGVDAGNYKVVAADASVGGLVQPAELSADITPCSIAGVSNIAGVDKVYDGSVEAGLNTDKAVFDGMIDGDLLAIGDAKAEFIDKNVGIDKAINIGGIVLAGPDAGNYILASDEATATASITPATVESVSGIKAQDKLYDGNTIAQLDTSAAIFNGMVDGDNLIVDAATGSFNDPELGIDKPVVIEGITLSGVDAGNYVLVSDQAATVASIVSVIETPLIEEAPLQSAIEQVVTTVNANTQQQSGEATLALIQSPPLGPAAPASMPPGGLVAGTIGGGVGEFGANPSVGSVPATSGGAVSGGVPTSSGMVSTTAFGGRASVSGRGAAAGTRVGAARGGQGGEEGASEEDAGPDKKDKKSAHDEGEGRGAKKANAEKPVVKKLPMCS